MQTSNNQYITRIKLAKFLLLLTFLKTVLKKFFFALNNFVKKIIKKRRRYRCYLEFLYIERSDLKYFCSVLFEVSL